MTKLKSPSGQTGQTARTKPDNAEEVTLVTGEGRIDVTFRGATVNFES